MNVGTIGHIDHGRTTLTTALIRVLAEASVSERVCISDQYRTAGHMDVACYLDKRSRKAEKKIRMATAQRNAFLGDKSNG